MGFAKQTLNKEKQSDKSKSNNKVIGSSNYVTQRCDFPTFDSRLLGSSQNRTANSFDTGIIQRYRDVEQGKRSDRGSIYLKDQNLYATEEKINDANMVNGILNVSGGRSFTFKSDEENEGPNLKEVIVDYNRESGKYKDHSREILKENEIAKPREKEESTEQYHKRLQDAESRIPTHTDFIIHEDMSSRLSYSSALNRFLEVYEQTTEYESLPENIQDTLDNAKDSFLELNGMQMHTEIKKLIEPEETNNTQLHQYIKLLIALTPLELEDVTNVFLGASQYLDANKKSSLIQLPSDCQVFASAVSNIEAKDLDVSDLSLEDEERQDLTNIQSGDVYKAYPAKTNPEWNYHYETVFMVDGGEHVTIQNAGSKKSDGFNKIPNDRLWSYNFYGGNDLFSNRYSSELGASEHEQNEEIKNGRKNGQYPWRLIKNPHNKKA